MEKFPNDVRIVVKNNALPFHKRAMPAAEATLAAHAQGKYWEMHDKLFENQRALEDADLERYAQEIGLDMAKFKADMSSHKYKPLVEKDMELAGTVNARGTPNFFVNGRNVRGAQPYEAFEAVVNEELPKAKAMVDGGTPAKDVYAKLIANGKVFEPLDSTAHDLVTEGRPFFGNPDGDLVIAEFSDFQ
jgi:protein-disulfide isomerase